MIKAMESSWGEIFSVCEEARDSIYIVAGNYRKQGDDTETLNSGWRGEPIKHNRIVNGISSVSNPCISLLWLVQNDGFYKKISFFDQYSSLRTERVEFIVHTFSNLYEIVKKGKGRYVVLKDRISEAKKALGIEVDDDDDMPFWK